MPRFWLSRLYAALSVLVGVVVATTAHTSLAYQVVSRAGVPGWIGVLVLGAFAVAAVVDVIVNDLMPERFDLPRARRWRHLVYLALAMGLVSITYLLDSVVGYTPLMLSYWLDAAMCTAIAFFDLFSRHRGGRKAS